MIAHRVNIDGKRYDNDPGCPELGSSEVVPDKWCPLNHTVLNIFNQQLENPSADDPLDCPPLTENTVQLVPGHCPKLE
jgi:hypothetical protein